MVLHWLALQGSELGSSSVQSMGSVLGSELGSLDGSVLGSEEGSLDGSVYTIFINLTITIFIATTTVVQRTPGFTSGKRSAQSNPPTADVS